MITFLLGRQTNNLQQETITNLTNDYLTDKTQKYFLIVPNHIKFDTEVKALKQVAVKTKKDFVSAKNLQVLSFSRLAWMLLNESDIKLPSALTDAAASMLLQKIIKEVQPELELYQTTKINPGIIRDLYGAILQLQIGNITPAKLSSFELDQVSLETRTKLHDLKIIYPDFMKVIGDKFVTKQETLSFLNEQLLTNQINLSNISFYFSDFSQFSPQEMLTIKILIQNAKNVSFAFKTATGDYQENASQNSYDGNVQLILKNLIHFISKQNQTFRIEKASLPAVSKPLVALNKLWIGGSEVDPTTDFTKAIQLVKADSRYSEAYFVAQTIYREVALNQRRYRDFIVLAPNLSDYETHIGPIFKRLNIPYFNDLQKQMKFHPLVIFIEAFFELVKHPYQTNAIIKLLKSGLIQFSKYSAQKNQELADQLENFVLKNGINWNSWKKDFREVNHLNETQITDEAYLTMVEEIQSYKEQLISNLDNAITRLKNSTDTNSGLDNFTNFLQQLKIPTQLENWRDQANEAGDLQLAQQPEEVWALLNQLLDDYRLINPENFDPTEFFETLAAGFSEATFSQIPSTLDAVVISELGMVQSNQYEQCFIIGATSSDLPSPMAKPKFLNSENIEELNTNFDLENSILIDNQDKTNLQLQKFMFGQALLTGTNRVYLTYPQINEENKQLKPSLYYEKIKTLAQLPEYYQYDLPEVEGSNIGSYLSTPLSSAGYLSYLVNNPDTNDTTRTKATDLLKMAQKKEPTKIAQFLNAQKFDNRPQKISASQAEELFGQNLSTSVSQLETYYQNPFEYFLNYGLKLKKRNLNDFDAMQTGNYFHEIFDRFVKYINDNQLDLQNLSKTELNQIILKITSTVEKLPKYQKFFQDELNIFLASKLNQTADSILENMTERTTKTPLVPEFSEVIFGQNNQLNPLHYELNDHQIYLRGKIDRIDLAQTNEGVLTQIIDYKSSTKDFNLTNFYHGLILQIVSYLKVLQNNQSFFTKDKPLLLGGAFYQTISKQPISFNKKGLTAKLTRKDLEAEFLKKQRLAGIMVSDTHVLPLLEPNIKRYSEIYKGFKFEKGSFKTGANGFKPDELELLMNYNDHLIKNAAKEIYQGNFPLLPYKTSNQNAITNSDYKDILFFDAMLPENNYNKISTVERDDLLKQMEQELLDDNLH